MSYNKKSIMEEVLGSSVLYIVATNHTYSVHICTRNSGNIFTLNTTLNQ